QRVGHVAGDLHLRVGQGRRTLGGGPARRPLAAGEVAQPRLAVAGDGDVGRLVPGRGQVRDLGRLAPPLEALGVVVVGDRGDVAELDRIEREVGAHAYGLDLGVAG